MADQLRTNSKLKPSEYATPVLGLIFLRYAEYRFDKAKKKIQEQNAGSRRIPGKSDYQRLGALYLPKEARYSNILKFPEGDDIKSAVINAMKAIEVENEDLKDVLPKLYTKIPKDILFSLLKLFSEFEMDEHGEIFGATYKYFLGKFALAEGQKGGEFFTPTCFYPRSIGCIDELGQQQVY